MAHSNSPSKSSERQAAEIPADPRLPTVTWPSLLEPLGVIGFERLEPVLCAALVSEEPLLLIHVRCRATTARIVASDSSSAGDAVAGGRGVADSAGLRTQPGLHKIADTAEK